MLEKSHQTLLVQWAIKSIWKKTHAPPPCYQDSWSHYKHHLQCTYWIC
jgi:hypothetical protein